MTKFLLSIGIIVAFIVALSLWGFYLAIRPLRITSTHTPKDFNIAFEDISFYTSDKVLLHGWFIPNKNPKAKTIILLHGYPADKGNILPAMLFLHKDYNLLFFDFRYFGKSDGHYSTIGKNEVLDLLAAIKYLHTRGINKVGVWGFSLGGAVALMGASKAPEIKAIVSESAYARLDLMAYDYYPIPFFRYPLTELTRLWAKLFLGYDIKSISPVDAAKKLNVPTLLIHSKQDNVVSFKHAQLFETALKHNSKAQMIFTDDNEHGQLIQNHESIIKQFFQENMK